MATNDNYNLLITKINTFIKKYYLNKLLRGLIFLGAGIFSAYVVITLTEYFGNFDTVFRSILFYGFILLNLALIAWLVAPPLMAYLKLGKTLSHDEAAQIIGKHFNDVNDKLLNTLQLKKLAESDERHRQLIEASIDQKIDTLKPVRFPSAINIRDNRRYLKWVLAPAAVIIIIAFAAPSILTESTKRLINHNKYFAPVSPFKFVVLNQSLSVVQGDDLQLNLKLQGDKFPADVYIETANNSFKLDKENTSSFHYLFSNLQQNVKFKLVGNGFASEEYEVKVNLRPSIMHFDVKLDYPAYLHKPNETLANAGDIIIPAGTKVTWAFHTQNSSALSFYMNNRAQTLTPVSDNVFEHTERVLSNAVYKLNPINNMVKHTDSVAYRINVIADEMPSISVDEKPDSVSMKAFYFNGQIQDDHGFSVLTFHYKISPGGNKDRAKAFVKPVKADLGGNTSGFFFFWSLKDLGVKPGDEVTYYFEVADNDGVSGPKRVQSPERTLNMPDAAQLEEQLNAGTEAVKQKMQSASKLAGEIEKDAQRLNQLLLNKNSLSFDEKKQLEDLLQKRKDLDNLVKEIQDENKKNMYNRRENQKQSDELAEEQKQIEKLLENAIDPKTQQLLEKLKELMENRQKEGTREQLSKMQQENRSTKREFDRLLELYKKMEFEQKVNQNINKLNQLAEKQEKLAQETKQSDQQKAGEQNKQDTQKAGDQNKDQKAGEQNKQDQQKGADQAKDQQQQKLEQEQQKLNKQFEDIAKSLEQLAKDAEKDNNKQDFKNPEREEDSIQEEMKNSSEQLKKNQKQKASQSQQQSAKQMKQLAQKMQEEQQEGEEQENEVNIKQLRELLKSLVNSSFTQEKVMETLKGTSPVDPNYVTLAQTQKTIKDNLKTAEDSLYALSKRIPQIEATVTRELASINTRIDQAIESLGERRTFEANRSQQYAMTSMNNLALMLSEALNNMQDKMSQKKGKGKPKPSMQQLSKMQQQLNQNMERMRQQMQQQGNKGQTSQQRSQQSEQFARMAREQQMIRQQMEQLSRDDSKNGGTGVKNADKISQQMEQTENDLVNRRITDDALKRQQQIQSRLLEAEKAEQEREQDQKREGHAGKDMPPGYIKALQDYQQAKDKQTEQIRTVTPALNLYYKKKIRSYFDQLNGK